MKYSHKHVIFYINLPLRGRELAAGCIFKVSGDGCTGLEGLDIAHEGATEDDPALIADGFINSK